MLLILLACRTPPDSGEAPADDTSDSATDSVTADLFQGFVPTNIVVFHVDTMRWDHLPWYGYARNTFPRLSERPGWVRWDRMYSTSGWTAPSTASLVTGRDVHHHGVRIVTQDFTDALVGPTLTQFWKDQGYATIFVSGNEIFDIDSGTTAGFDSVTVLEREPLNAVANGEAALLELDALTPGTPFLLHLQPFDPHAAWYPSAAFVGTWSDPDAIPFDLEASRDAQRAALTEALRDADAAETAAIAQTVIDLYDEELLGVDVAVDSMIAELDRRGLLADTLVVISADHGETLFDRGQSFGHGDSLYQELTRQPLLFFNPALSDAAVDGCVGWNVDIHPTLLRAVGLPLPDGLDGRPLQEGCRTLTTASLYREDASGSELELRQIAAQTESVAILRRCGLEDLVFDLDSDPLSQDPLRDATQPDVAVLRASLDEVLAAARETWPGVDCAIPE